MSSSRRLTSYIYQSYRAIAAQIQTRQRLERIWALYRHGILSSYSVGYHFQNHGVLCGVVTALGEAASMTSQQREDGRASDGTWR